jgi:DUF4097 and DUF4098 domain-containing protein YvlB
MSLPAQIPVVAVGMLLTLPGILPAQEETFGRDGPFWVQTISGTVSGRVLPQLHVVSLGKVIVRGGAANNLVTYKLTRKIRARTEDAARRVLGTASATTKSYGGMTHLVATGYLGNFTPITEFEVSLPRSFGSSVLVEQQWGGGIEAYDIDGGFQATTPSGAMQLDRIKGDVLVRTGGGELRLGKIDGSVQCTTLAGSIYLDRSGGRVRCTTGGGDIIVGESGGPVAVFTQGGNIHVGRAAGPVEARSAEGLIEVGQAGGVVTADTRGGSIQVDSAQGVRAESALGMLRVKSGAAPMDLAAQAGSILAELLAGTRIQDSSLVAGAGDITVLIPSKLAVTVVATNEFGGATRIVAPDFPEIRANPAALIRPSALAQGAINGGGPVLRLNSGGVIYLRRIK